MSTYLSTRGSFEQAIKRGLSSTRSPALDRLVAAIDLFVLQPSQGGIFDVKEKLAFWQTNDPKEFFARGTALSADINQEVNVQLAKWDPDGEDPDIEELPGQLQIPDAPAVAMNRWNQLKKGAKATNNVVGKAASAAGHAAILGSVAGHAGIPGSSAAAVAVTAAVSATGVGAIIVPVAIQVGTTYLAVKSYSKTESHVKNLLAIYYARKNVDLRCNPVDFQANPAAPAVAIPAGQDAQHTLIADTVLPYLIRQKIKKRKRKAIAALPVIGSAEGLRGMINKTYKWGAGSLGKERQNAAGLLAAHFIQQDCPLSQAIVAELYSVEEMEWMKNKELDEVKTFLCDKMKSV